jgi:hypothetical protein
MRLFVATAIALFGFVAAFGQSGSGSLAGTYKLHSPCTGCDSIVKTLKLECNPNCRSGRYTWTMAGYYECVKDVRHKNAGEWYVLPNEGDAKKENVKVIVLDVLGQLETYPLYLVQSDGSLKELKQRNPERFPQSIVKKDGKLYICKKGGHMESLDKATRFKDNPFYHIYTKKK